jgi:hypothetical protein
MSIELDCTKLQEENQDDLDTDDDLDDLDF